MPTEVAKWARDNFDQAFDKAGPEIVKIQAEQAKERQLSNGRAPIPMVNCFVELTREALDRTLTGYSHRIEDRGKDWLKGLNSIESELCDHIERGRVFIMRKASLDSGKNLADGMLISAENALVAEIRHYREGWTSPAGKSWLDRHPRIANAISGTLGAIGGAILASATPEITALLK